MSSNRWVLLGASRGFGAELAQILEAESAEVLRVARNFQQNTPSSTLKWDLSRPEEWPRLAGLLQEFAPTHIVYVAGGGPFGAYANKEWKDHEWAWRVTFQAPAFLLHWFLNANSSLKAFYGVGSAVAEDQADPGASSYAAAKHALKGLITSVGAEAHLKFSVGLWSPGYMDTLLLPPNAKPRHDGSPILSPEFAAKAFLDWAQSDARSVHLQYLKSSAKN